MTTVPDPARENARFAATLVDELVAAGLGHAVISPGSRSAPLALAFGRDVRVRVHVVHDERSAAFFAVGLGALTGRAAALVCTSGTAAANFWPAVAEADHARRPLLVLTADRPPESHGVGAPQTMDQTNLYGAHVRWFAEPGPPDDRVDHDAETGWRRLGRRAFAATTDPEPGPVHLNLAFREPLVGPSPAAARVPPRTSAPTSASNGDAVGRPADVTDAIERLAEILDSTAEGVIVAGFGADRDVDADIVFELSAAAGWPVVADAISGLRRPGSISGGEAVVSSRAFTDAHVPRVVLRIGAQPVTRAVGGWLASLPDSTEHVLVDPFDGDADPDRLATWRVVGPADAILSGALARLHDSRRDGPWAPSWSDAWLRADAAARAASDTLLDAGRCVEARVARDTVAATPAGSIVAVASSMPVRDVDAFAPARSDVVWLANRGVNGIDGFTSTVLGAAVGSGRKAVALLGDLCFLHDTNGLLGAAQRGADAVLVVVDNDGGGIFSFLAQREHCDDDEFDELFGTPHGLDLVAVALSHGVAASRVAPGDVSAAITARLQVGGVHVVVVESDREANLAAHREVRTAMVEAVEAVDGPGN